MKAWPVLAIAFIQGILLLAHWFIFSTWIDFWGSPGPWGRAALRDVLCLLAFSFITAALLGFYFSNPLVTWLYRLAAVWLGLLNFFFLAALLCRLLELPLSLLGLSREKPAVAAALFGTALAVAIYGLLNARRIRVRQVPIQLPHLPLCWQGRKALVLSDLHLGHVNGPRFSRRMVTLARRLAPDVVFLPGDLFDGSKVDAEALAAPFRELRPPLGIFFATGNHDEFGNAAHYSAVLTRAGVRVLDKEAVTVDGVQIIGVSYDDSSSPMRLRAILEKLPLVPGQTRILLNHVPTRLALIEQAGISLQLSGHTHGGQIFPFTWLTRRAFGKFTYGLERFGQLQVLTSSGAGTWGPPMRVGTHPEVVLLQFGAV